MIRQMLVATFLMICISGQAWARVELGDFVPELKRHRLPARYIELALNQLGSVSFSRLPENVEAVYNRFHNSIELRYELQDPSTGRLKAFALLTEDQVATIIHELFHCYFSRISKVNNDDFYRYWQQQADELYSDHGGDYHEEAYAAFLSETFTRYLNQRRMMQSRTSEVRVRLRANVSLKKMYEDSFRQFYAGYYRNWMGNFVNSDVNLPETDRQNILIRLLDRELPSDFKTAFSEAKF